MTTDNTSQTPAYELKPEALVDACPARQISFPFPEPMRNMLKNIISGVEEAGAGITSQRELFASLVLYASSLDPEIIAQMLRDYRLLRVQDLPSNNTV